MGSLVSGILFLLSQVKLMIMSDCLGLECDTFISFSGSLMGLRQRPCQSIFMTIWLGIMSVYWKKNRVDLNLVNRYYQAFLMHLKKFSNF